MADDNGFVGIFLFGARSQMTANRLQDKVKYYGLVCTQIIALTQILIQLLITIEKWPTIAEESTLV